MHRPALLALTLLAPAGRAAGPPHAEFFEKHVRPVLVNHCVTCHGATAQKGGLRLDSRAAVLKGGDSGAAVVPGEAGKSHLVAAVRHTSDELKMPPSGKLPAADIAALEKWVSLGLPWPDGVQLAPPDAIAQAAKKHWAFQPVERPTVPANPERERGGSSPHPIDAFILAKLDAAGLKPNPEADRRTLLRRVTFDLHGLPPTANEVAAFEADAAPGAWERVIDRLLSSPRYGERWGRYWLDVARYADNKGYVFFEDKAYPWAWTYRDYVIAAFNADKPFDRFVLEQLAADQLKSDDPKALAALGFLTVGGHFMNNTHDIIDDRIDVVTRGLMGLTVTCARCHDHKFDPIPAADYYSLYGVFRSSTEPVVPPLLGPPPSDPRHMLYDAELKLREAKLGSFVIAKHRGLVDGARARVAKYLLAAHAARNTPPADDFMLLADPGDLNPTMITRWRQHLADARKRRDPVWAHWHVFAELPDVEFATKAAAVAPKGGTNALVRDAFSTPPKSMKEVAERYAALLAEVDWKVPPPGAAAVAGYAAGGVASRRTGPDADALRAVLYGPRSPADAPLALDWGFLSLFPDRATQGEYQRLLKAVEQWTAKGPPRAMVLFDSPRPHDPQVFERGHPGKPGAYVPRQFLAVANPQRKPFTAGSGRLELAREIVSKDNPLTARVFVNRVWMHLFGTGLVTTPGDFGLRSDAPSHPDLLDWLSSELMEPTKPTHGRAWACDGPSWSTKRLLKLILTSTTYKQSSRDRGDAVAADPENRLLWKANRRRLDAEALHDAILAASGTLDPKMGGPPVPPFAGARRAVYWYTDRLEFPSLLTTFDVPNPATSSPQRANTTVAPQALYLMNGPLARTAARKLLASPALSKGVKLDAVFRALFARKPTDAERKLATDFLAEGPQAERWADLVHGLMMTNEFCFID